jgi:hypothetical protein
VDIQSQVTESVEVKQSTTEKRLNIALGALVLFIISSIGLLETLIKTKRLGRKRGKIKK